MNEETMEKIASEAFEDELQKIAKSEAFAKILGKIKGAAGAVAGASKRAAGAVAGAGKKVGGAYKSSWEELKGLKSTYGRADLKGIIKGMAGKEGGRTLASAQLKALAKSTGKAALIPATVTGISLAGYKAAKD